MQMLQHDGVRFDRRLHGVILCIYELSYFDAFPMLEVIEIQRAVVLAENESSQ